MCFNEMVLFVFLSYYARCEFFFIYNITRDEAVQLLLKVNAASLSSNVLRYILKYSP